MVNQVFRKMLFVIAMILATGATAFANIILDLDTNDGNQGVQSAQIKAGETKEIELIAEKGALGIAGFEIAIEFDTNQFTFKGFQPGGLMTGAITLPQKNTATGVTLSVGFLGGKSAADKGSLGKLQIEATQNLKTGGKIALTKGSFGSSGQTTEFALTTAVSLTTAAAKDATTGPIPESANIPPPGSGPVGSTVTPPGQGGTPPGQGGTPPGQQPGFQNPGQRQQPGQPPQGQGQGGPPGQGGTPPGQQGQGGPPGQGGTPPGQQPGFQNPGQGQPSSEELRKLFEQWQKSPEFKDLNGDGKTDTADFKIFFDKQRASQQPQGQGQGGTPPGQGGTPPGQQPQGQGHQPGQQHQGQGQPGQGAPGQQPGFQNPGQGQGGTSPEVLISTLPSALQPSFKNTLQFSKKAHIEAELKAQESILKTMQETKQYLVSATPEEKATIAKVLSFFNQGPPSAPTSPSGAGTTTPATLDADQLVNKIIEFAQKKIETLKKDLSSL